VSLPPAMKHKVHVGRCCWPPWACHTVRPTDRLGTPALYCWLNSPVTWFRARRMICYLMAVSINSHVAVTAVSVTKCSLPSMVAWWRGVLC
jgi:hypothetical protein